MSSNVEVRVPDLGGAAGVKVIEVLVAVGDTVDKEQPLLRAPKPVKEHWW